MAWWSKLSFTFQRTITGPLDCGENFHSNFKEIFPQTKRKPKKKPTAIKANLHLMHIFV
jgi:hypothetical protein